MKLASILYNQREGEKKNFRLKPFRSRTITKPTVQQKSITPSTPGATEIVTKVEAKPTVTHTVSTTPSLGKRSLILKSSESLSIKKTMQQSVAKGADSTATEAAAREAATREYSTQEIEEAWMTFASEKLKHNMQVQSAFKVASLELKLGNVLRVSFPSATQQMYFNDYRSQLTDFLRETSDIRGLDFIVEIMKQGEIKAQYQTSKQKFDALVQKNPALETLRKKFNLQIDF